MSDTCSACYNCFLNIVDTAVAYNSQTQKYHYTIYHNGKTLENQCECNTCNVMYLHYAIHILLQKMKNYSIKLQWGYRKLDKNDKVKKIPFDRIKDMRQRVSNILKKLGYNNVKISKCCDGIDCIHYIITFQPIQLSIDETGCH